MATNQPQNLSEWQLHCVLKRASLIQYYDSFINNGEVDVIKLAESDDIVFKDIMEKVGMAKKPLHVRQFRNTLLEWTKDPGKNKHVPSYIQTADDAKCATAVLSLKSTAVSGSNSRLPQIQNDDDEKWKKQNEHCTIFKQHGLIPFYDELLNKTVLDKTVLDSLISRCILMIEDREEITKPTTQRERNRVLLDILIERPYDTMEMLKDILKESEPQNSDVQEIFCKMQCTENTVEQISCHDIIIHDYVIKLQKNYLMFVNNVDCKTDLLDHLYGTGVLDTEEKEEVGCLSHTRHESNRILLNKLVRKGEDAYTHLVEALRHGQYNDVASEMENTQVSELEIQLCQIGMKKLIEREKGKDVRGTHTNIEELAHDEVIPKHILEQFERRLNQWKFDDKQFVNITAEKKVMEHIMTESTVTIVGNSGTGKSFLSRHVAVAMMKQGYIIIPCDNPGDIRQWFKPGRKTLFVFDDVCGRYILNQQIYNDWKQRLDHITYLLKDKCCKIMVTCRLDVYKNDLFRRLFIFRTCIINLSSKDFKLNAAEKLALAEMYFKDNANKVTELSEKYEFFPLLCSLYHQQQPQKHVNLSDFFSNPFGVFQNELDDWYSEGKTGKVKYCCLVLCVMLNNTLNEENFNTKDRKIVTVLEHIFEECELKNTTPLKSLHKTLETFEGTYVVKEDSTYKIIHDKLFDFLASFFGKKMLQLFIEHANADFIKERFVWKAADSIDTEMDFAIGIPNSFINTYINRLLKDWENGFVINVFTNKNMTSLQFTEKFINCINQIDKSKQEALASIKDNEFKDTALGITCLCGIGNLIEWLISRKSDINQCDSDGFSPLYKASAYGHVDVVKELIQHSAEINQTKNNVSSSLIVASQEGHFNVVKELLQHSPEVNLCMNNGVSPLLVASGKGHVNIVKLLLQHSSDVNLCSNIGNSPLCLASREGQLDVVKELIQNSAAINQCDSDGLSPLYNASAYGHVDVVKELIQHSAEINQTKHNGSSSLLLASHEMDINLCDENGCSPLYWASQEGHFDVVKELLLHSPDVNKCSNDGVSPLSRASFFNKTEVVKVLLQCDEIDINLCDKDGRSSLYWASRFGHIDVVTEFLQHAVEVNQCDNEGFSPLYNASACGHVDVVKELIQHSAEINQTRNTGSSSLLAACQQGYFNVVKELLQHSPEVNLCMNNGASPLLVASGKGHVNIVKLLLQHSSDVNLCSNIGNSPLCLASLEGQLDVVKELIQNSAAINQCNNDGESPLYQASCKGNVDVVKELLQHSPDVNKCSNDGVSPLSRASFFNKTEVVKVLLQCDEVDINLCDEDGCSPLYWASYEGHVDVVKELIQHSAEVNKCSNVGDSPLSIASYFNKTEVVKILLQCDEVDINLCDEDGRSALYWASNKGHVDVVKELIQHSAEVNKCSNVGDSPLSIASYFNKTEVVKILLQCDEVDINLCDEDGRSALYWASNKGHVDVVKKLLQHSAEVNKCANDGASPLYTASESGHVSIVKILLRHSAEVNTCKNDSSSSLYKASQNGHVDVVKELLQHSANVNKCLNDGTPPLQIACFNNKIDVLKVLLQCSDVEIDICDNDGRSSLYWACQQGHIDVVKELLKYSANVNKCRTDGTSPLQIACYTMRTDVVKELLKCDDVDIDHCDNDGCTSLYLASRQGHVNVVKELLLHFADINIGDAQGKTPLCIAQKQGHVEEEALLLGKQ